MTNRKFAPGDICLIKMIDGFHFFVIVDNETSEDVNALGMRAEIVKVLNVEKGNVHRWNEEWVCKWSSSVFRIRDADL